MLKNGISRVLLLASKIEPYVIKSNIKFQNYKIKIKSAKFSKKN
jgi:hypothetical protein